MDYEKKYKEALERAKDMLTYKKVRKEDMEYLFPELKESEDERIRNGLIKAVSGILKGNTLYGTDVTREEALAWLEKQDKHLKNYDEAEKEKTDFVSGQFIECRKSFNGFKEDNSYWFEYVGDDIYIGRSDNILNQKFHITPRQLYRLFSQQHSPKEDSNVNDEANAPTEYGKYVDECLNEASKHFFSNGEDKYSVADLFYAGVRCGRLEKQGEQTNKINLQKITFEDVLALECAMKTVKITKGGNKLYEMLVLLYNKIHNAYLVEKQGEQKSQGKLALEAANEEKVDNQNCVKPAYKVESKFKAGDWIVWQGKYFKVNYNGCGYELTDQNGKSTSLEYGAIDETANLWTIQDAKAGDVLYSPKGAGVECIFLIEDWKQLECTGKTLCSSIVYRVEDDEIVVCEHGAIWWEGVVDLFYPATKEQRDLLFQKMKEAGYKWDAEKKELKKSRMKKLDADKVIEWLKTHGNLVPIVTIKINEVVDKFKKDFGLCLQKTTAPMK